MSNRTVMVTTVRPYKVSGGRSLGIKLSAYMRLTPGEELYQALLDDGSVLLSRKRLAVDSRVGINKEPGEEAGDAP